MEDKNMICECPKCGYKVSYLELITARFDYPCPECEKARISEFGAYEPEEKEE